MTTGDLEGSDPFPFGLVITSAAPPGTAFAPNIGSQPGTAGFFFTRMGTDNVVGTQRNLVLLGGGVSLDPASGNAAFWIQDLRLTMSVPEPGIGLWSRGGCYGARRSGLSPMELIRSGSDQASLSSQIPSRLRAPGGFFVTRRVGRPPPTGTHDPPANQEGRFFPGGELVVRGATPPGAGGASLRLRRDPPNAANGRRRGALRARSARGACAAVRSRCGRTACAGAEPSPEPREEGPTRAG